MKPRLLVLALSAALLSTVAHALPEMPQVDARRDSSKATPQLDPVVVTADLRERDIQDVPMSVSVLAPETLELSGSGLADIKQIGNRAPSIQAESSFGRTFPRFFIRGLGNTDFDLNASQPVSMVYDDVVLENPTLKGYPIFDIEHVEILRGPQGTLFGRNSPAGTIRFVSRRPDDALGGYMRLGYGRFGSAQMEAAVNVPVNDRSGFRLSTLFQHRDDFSRNDAIPGDEREGFNERALRAQWLLRPTDDLDVLVQARARSLDGGSVVYQSNLIERGSGRIVSDYSRFRLAQDAIPTLEVDAKGLSTRIDWRLSGVTLTSITGYESLDMFARGDVDGGFGAAFAPPFGRGDIPFPAESGDGIPDHRQFSQEIRLRSDAEGSYEWQVGALYFDEALDIENISYDTLSGSVQNGFAQQHQDDRSWAVFGTLGVALSERWRVDGGVRYTDDQKDFWAERTQSPFGSGGLARQTIDVGDNNLSGDLSVSFDASEDTHFYARVATGFRAPAIQGRILFGDTISVARSETVESVELGLKQSLIDGQAQLRASLYRYRVNDMQLTAVGGQANFNTLINADAAQGEGAELEFSWRPLSALTLEGGVSYNRTEIDDPTLGVQPCASPCTVLDPVGSRPGTVAIDGNGLPQSPRWISQINARYEQPFSAGRWYVSTDWAYRSKINFFLYDSVEFTGAALLEGGLRVGFVTPDDRHELALVGRNILDEIEVVGGVDFNNLTGFVNEPRYVGLEYTFRR